MTTAIDDFADIGRRLKAIENKGKVTGLPALVSAPITSAELERLKNEVAQAMLANQQSSGHSHQFSKAPVPAGHAHALSLKGMAVFGGGLGGDL